MKKLLFLCVWLGVTGGIVCAQQDLVFSPVFSSLGLGPQDVSIKSGVLDVEDSLAFTMKQVPGYNLFVWLESADTSANMLLKPHHNYQSAENGIWTARLAFPRPGIWNAAVFFIPQGTSQLLKLFGFKVNVAAAADEEETKRLYEEETGIRPD